MQQKPPTSPNPTFKTIQQSHNFPVYNSSWPPYSRRGHARPTKVLEAHSRTDLIIACHSTRSYLRHVAATCRTKNLSMSAADISRFVFREWTELIVLIAYINYTYNLFKLIPIIFNRLHKKTDCIIPPER